MCTEKRALKERLSAIMKSKEHTKLTVLISAIIFLAVTLTACAMGATSNTQDSVGEDLQATALPTYESPETPERSEYPIIINGVGFMYNFYTLESESAPTHVPLAVVDILGLDIMQGGSQIAIQRNGEGLAFLNVINYLTFGDDRIEVGSNDTFMVDDDYRYQFTIYVPISLFRELGFEAYFMDDHVHIYGDGSNQQEPTQHEEAQSTGTLTETINIANLMGVNFSEVQHLFGTLVRVDEPGLFRPHWFDTGLMVGTDDWGYGETIVSIIVSYDQAGSAGFHYDTIDTTFTRDDVRARLGTPDSIFPNEYIFFTIVNEIGWPEQAVAIFFDENDRVTSINFGFNS